MASKKQRRRREKERRHEYEYVYVDEEGREVPVDDAEPGQKNGKAPTAQRTTSGRGGRTVDPPSWRRTLRRGAIFAPLMLIVVYLLQGKDKNVPGAVLQTVFLLVLFIPFSYFMDSLMYRSFRKRAGAKGGGNNATRR